MTRDRFKALSRVRLLVVETDKSLIHYPQSLSLGEEIILSTHDRIISGIEDSLQKLSSEKFTFRDKPRLLIKEEFEPNSLSYQVFSKMSNRKELIKLLRNSLLEAGWTYEVEAYTFSTSIFEGISWESTISLNL